MKKLLYSNDPTILHRLALLGGVLAKTVSPLFIRWADAPPIVTSFYRMLGASLLILIILPFSRGGNKEWNWKFMVFPVLGGIAAGFDHFFWGSAINLTTVANATLLNNIAPVWVVLIALLVWKERINKSHWTGLVLVLAGLGLVFGSTIINRPTFIKGDYYAIISSVFYAFFFLAGQKGRQGMKTLNYLLIMFLCATIVLSIFAAFFDLPLTGYSARTYLLFLSAAIFSQFGSYFLITYALGKLPASVVTPTMVAQPVLTALMAIPITGESILLSQAIGGVITIFGIYFINRIEIGTSD